MAEWSALPATEKATRVAAVCIRGYTGHTRFQSCKQPLASGIRRAVRRRAILPVPNRVPVLGGRFGPLNDADKSCRVPDAFAAELRLRPGPMGALALLLEAAIGHNTRHHEEQEQQAHHRYENPEEDIVDLDVRLLRDARVGQFCSTEYSNNWKQ